MTGETQTVRSVRRVPQFQQTRFAATDNECLVGTQCDRIHRTRLTGERPGRDDSFRIDHLHDAIRPTDHGQQRIGRKIHRPDSQRVPGEGGRCDLREIPEPQRPVGSDRKHFCSGEVIREAAHQPLVTVKCSLSDTVGNVPQGNRSRRVTAGKLDVVSAERHGGDRVGMSGRCPHGNSVSQIRQPNRLVRTARRSQQTVSTDSSRRHRQCVTRDGNCRGRQIPDSQRAVRAGSRDLLAVGLHTHTFHGACVPGESQSVGTVGRVPEFQPPDIAAGDDQRLVSA